MPLPIVIKPIPSQMVNEQAAFGPFNLNEYIQEPNGQSALRFSAELSQGGGLPRGMICTEDGLFTGIPGKETNGMYEITVTANNAEGNVQTKFVLTIKPGLGDNSIPYVDQLKAQVWHALDHRLPAPDLSELYHGTVSSMDVYYLLERWATLIIWNASDLSPAGKPILMKIANVSEHFNVYDRGSSIVATPKDLFSQQRTTADALQTARAMVHEVYKREWIVELAGFEKMARAAWVEFQHLEDKYGRKVEILHYDPSFKELRVYSREREEALIKRAEQR